MHFVIDNDICDYFYNLAPVTPASGNFFQLFLPFFLIGQSDRTDNKQQKGCKLESKLGCCGKDTAFVDDAHTLPGELPGDLQVRILTCTKEIQSMTNCHPNPEWNCLK